MIRHPFPHETGPEPFTRGWWAGRESGASVSVRGRAAPAHSGAASIEKVEAGKMDAVRTCVACRERDSRATLLRVVVRDGQFCVDDRAILPGRGSWVHPTAECLKLAVTRGAFPRALRVSRKLDASPLENRLKTLMDN